MTVESDEIFHLYKNDFQSISWKWIIVEVNNVAELYWLAVT